MTPVRGAPPEAQKITPELIEAAKKEGKVTWYTSVDLPLAEKVAKAFEAKYPGVAMKVERSGAERNFQRIGQEYASKIYDLRRGEQLRRRPPDHLEARRVAGTPTCPRTWRATSRRRTRTPTACSPRGA